MSDEPLIGNERLYFVSSELDAPSVLTKQKRNRTVIVPYSKLNLIEVKQIINEIGDLELKQDIISELEEKYSEDAPNIINLLFIVREKVYRMHFASFLDHGHHRRTTINIVASKESKTELIRTFQLVTLIRGEQQVHYNKIETENALIVIMDLPWFFHALRPTSF